MTMFSRNPNMRAKRRALAVICVCGAIVGAFAAMSGEASAVGTDASAASAASVQALVNKAFAAPEKFASLPPVIQDAFTHAIVPLSSAKLALAYKCWTANRCTVGSGKITLGIADGFGNNTWREFTKMEIILQALEYPQVGKIIYTNGQGVLATFQANLASLTAQGAKAIVTYDDFGLSAASAFAKAQKTGAVISSYVGPLPGMAASAVSVRVEPNICAAGKTMAAVTKKLVGSSPVAYFTGVAGNPEDAGWQKCATAAGVKSGFSGITSWTPAGVDTATAALIASGKAVKAILYSYSNPMTEIIKLYQQAKKPVPDLITWTQDNGLSCAWKNTKPAFALYQTNALNWVSRVSVTATLEKLAGKSVPAVVNYPQPFIAAKASDCNSSLASDYPGNSSLIPASLTSKILGG
jgi:ABC-type sugar transport system substrate-binding protein